MSTFNRILLVIVIVLAVATAIFWFQPELLSTISALNPFNIGRETAPMTANNSNAQPSRNNSTSPPTASQTVTPPEGNNGNQEEPVKEAELTPLEKEIQMRHESYQTQVYTYEPYVPPVLRNPFQRLVSTVYVEDEEEEEMIEELSTEQAVRRFVQPELPPGSKYTGVISAGEEKLAILEIDEETYIVKEGDLILDKFLVKSIDNEKVIMEINGHEISLILGGGEATDE